MEKLIATALQPVVQALEATGDINGKLIWSNTGYLINWYLGEMKTLLGDEKIAALRQHCFFEKQFSDGGIIRSGVRSFCGKGSSSVEPAASAIACRMFSSAGTAR